MYPNTGNTIDDEIEKVFNGTSDDNESVRVLNIIRNKIALNGFSYSVLREIDGVPEDITHTFKGRAFKYSRTSRKKEIIEDIIFIKGELYSAGGKSTINIHVGNYKIELTKDEARRLNEFLYKDLYLSVLKQTVKGSDEKAFIFMDTYLDEDTLNKWETFYKEITTDKSLERFDKIHNKIVELVNSEGIEGGQMYELMKLFDYDTCDRGILRTILMTLKPVRNPENIRFSELYKRLADKLRAGSTHNII